MIAVLVGRRIVYVNPAFLARTGYRASELHRMDPADLIAPAHRDEALKRRERRERGEGITDYETEIVDAHGGLLSVLVHGDPMEWEGKPGFKYELTDMTQRRLA